MSRVVPFRAIRAANALAAQVIAPPYDVMSEAEARAAKTEALLARINDDGRIYLTQTLHEGRYVIRVQVGQFDCTRTDVQMIAKVVAELMT